MSGKVTVAATVIIADLNTLGIFNLKTGNIMQQALTPSGSN